MLNLENIVFVNSKILSGSQNTDLAKEAPLRDELSGGTDQLIRN